MTYHCEKEVELANALRGGLQVKRKRERSVYLLSVKHVLLEVRVGSFLVGCDYVFPSFGGTVGSKTESADKFKVKVSYLPSHHLIE